MDLSIADRRTLYKDLMLGQGFHTWMTNGGDASVAEVGERLAGLGVEEEVPRKPPIRRIPSVNFLDIEDSSRASAIVNVALPEDRTRFCRYLEDRPLGFGIVVAVSVL